MSSHFTSSPATYYDVIEPLSTRKSTVVMVHGGMHSGACYLRTVDGRPGWAYELGRLGYRAVVPDWPGVGRSGYVADAELDGMCVCRGLAKVIEEQSDPVILLTHSMAGPFGWKLLEMLPDRLSLVVAIAPGPPGNVQTVPTILTETDEVIRAAVSPALPDMTIRRDVPIPPQQFAQKLIGSSTQFPRGFLEDYIASLAAIPYGLFMQRGNFYGSALRVDDPRRIAGKRIAIVHGTEDPDHTSESERAICNWLNANGATAEQYDLGEHGITGNGHMLMLELNSDRIAGFLDDVVIAAGR